MTHKKRSAGTRARGREVAVPVPVTGVVVLEVAAVVTGGGAAAAETTEEFVGPPETGLTAAAGMTGGAA